MDTLWVYTVVFGYAFLGFAMSILGMGVLETEFKEVNEEWQIALGVLLPLTVLGLIFYCFLILYRKVKNAINKYSKMD